MTTPVWMGCICCCCKNEGFDISGSGVAGVEACGGGVLDRSVLLLRCTVLLPLDYIHDDEEKIEREGVQQR